MTVEKPEVLDDIQEKASYLIRKWGPRPVEVRLNPEDHRRIGRYMDRKDQSQGSLTASPEEREGPTFTLQFQPVQIPEGDFILEVQEDPDSSERITI